MILKFLLVAAVIAVVYFMFIKEKPLPKNTADEKKAKDTKSSDMVECSTCKVYCEVDDALISGSKYYCSKECLEKRQ